MTGLLIGDVARATGLGVETIRYYERVGLLPPPPRQSSGYRRYPPDTLGRLDFIRRAKALGFSLREVGALLSLRATDRATCAEVRAVALKKMAGIDAKLVELEAMRQALERLAGACGARGPLSDCPLLDALEDGSGCPPSN